jgi:UDP:flavonoid glycosyltransferase YjiC (YdhE family)
VAAALGVPAVRHVHGVDVTHQARDVVPELIEPLTGRLGLDGVEILGDLTVDPCPPSMQIPVAVARQPVRYVPYNGPAVMPRWLWRRSSRPLVCITWGTSTTRLVGDDAFLPPRVIEMISGLGWEIVVSLAGHDVAALRALDRCPDDVRVVESVPLHLLLPTCDVVIHQGGNGTILTAVHDGVPQLVLPQLPDQMFHADRLADTSAGIVLRPSQVDTGSVRTGVETLLADGTYRAATLRLREELLAQRAPADIVPDLEALAR